MLTKYLEIQNYWSNNPCAGGNSKFPFKLFKDAKVLEIGCGMGVDAGRFVSNGAIYTGIDLTQKAVEETQVKIGNMGTVKVMNAEFIDFPDSHFDLVYSWGAIHHAITPKNIINEMYRVLKPNGFVCVMLYGKPSWRYFEIMVLRKILWHLHYYRYRTLRSLTPKPTKEQWISWNTDNLGCPMARVYTKQQALNLCNRFKIFKTWTERLGWFRILAGRKLPTT